MSKIGIYAGSFDPIHNGHIAFAEKAIKSGLDKVYFLVEPSPRRKQAVKAFQHRIDMTRLATSKNSKLGVIQLEQAKFTPQTTMPILQARFKDSQLVLMFGDDVISHMVDHLAEWPNIETLAKTSSMLIATRNYKKEDLIDKLQSLAKFGIKLKYKFVEPNFLSTSSSAIRLMMKKGVKPEEISPVVYEYILKYNIYASSNSTK